MTKRIKWLTLALLAGSATLYNGCLGAFWDGLWNTGWPGYGGRNNWINLAIDIVNEDLFG